MSEDREQAGAPVEQAQATDTQVLAAVERAAEVAGASEAGTNAESNAEASAAAGDAAAAAESLGSGAALADATSTATSERPVIAATSEPPNAGKLETAEEIFAAHTPQAGKLQRDAESVAEVTTTLPEEVAAAGVAATTVEATTNSAREVAGAEGAALPPVRDGEIRISADHPMAALYMQSPMPPEVKGNRGAGVLIALLSTLAFALVYAGVISLWLAPNYPPSTFLSDGLIPWLTNWGFIAAAVGFFVGFALLVLIVGRAGWWAYVLGGLLVALFTWAVALVGFALNDRLGGETVSLQPFNLLAEYGLFFPVLAAGIVAREVSVWFGAWIGARGRKIKRQNAEAIAEYETALAEVQAKQP